jgi:hypothetical protein
MAPPLEVMAGAPLEVNVRGSGDRARLVAPGSVVFWLGSEVITSSLVLVVEPRWQGKQSAMAEVVCAAEVAGFLGCH